MYTRILIPALCSIPNRGPGELGASPEPGTESLTPSGVGSKMCPYRGPEEDLEEGQAGTVRVAMCGTEDRLIYVIKNKNLPIAKDIK